MTGDMELEEEDESRRSDERHRRLAVADSDDSSHEEAQPLSTAALFGEAEGSSQEQPWVLES